VDRRRLGAQFEREIFAQPDVWERLALGTAAQRLAGALDDDVVLVGSGSSLFVAQLGALALRRRRIRAHAVAATEARLDHNAYENKTIVAVSQSGRSSDLLAALDVLAPRRLIALTNSAGSPLAARATDIIDVEAGPETAIPATKSVSASVATLLWAASLLGGTTDRRAGVLAATAAAIRSWFESAECDSVVSAAQRIARRHSVIVLGSDYGLPVACETALKLKEAAYLHAEGFSSGEFRHGSVAMVDAACAVIAIVDFDALPAVARALRDVGDSEALRYIIGSTSIDDVPRLGPLVDEPYNTLAWLVTAQLIALHAARTRCIDSDAPRGLTKALVTESTRPADR
jgi:glucosamine--fructose-6-phosphate aminotransferase (isomerizing)